MRLRYLFLLIICFLTVPNIVLGQRETLSLESRNKIATYLTNELRKEVSMGRVSILKTEVLTGKKQLDIYTNNDWGYYPFRKENVNNIYRSLKALIPSIYENYKISLYTNGLPIEDLVPGNLKIKTTDTLLKNPLVSKCDTPFNIQQGLMGRHIALWQSHGYYFNNKANRWMWQRPKLLQTIEDLYTQSYVLPYLVPMLENAGAIILLPRERDTQNVEAIVDNDSNAKQGNYFEYVGEKEWQQGASEGFANLQDYYQTGENPFLTGTYRKIESIVQGEESMAWWEAKLPQAGEYAIYVSYKSFPNSIEDATYTVHHKGGSTSFKVNQRMGGGTWIYLGKFFFDKEGEGAPSISLSNYSKKANGIVTADAVKIGGGMGNIARPITSATNKNKQQSLVVSNQPRFTEGARYWLQWAGCPDSVYNHSNNINDYRDDYMCRGKWVNYLAGGSTVLPNTDGLGIPIDLAFGFHTDAGITPNDSIVGTLGIYYTGEKEPKKFANGRSKYLSRELTDIIQTQIVQDIRQSFEPNWNRRGMYDRQYAEASAPQVPTMLLELLSHQNLADMCYGQDPKFRFTVSRAIYKGILRYLARQSDLPYVVQPLPVTGMQLTFSGKTEIELKWQPTNDPLEPTATPNQYLVYTRIDDEGFDQGQLVNKNSIRLPQQTGKIYSYYVTAINDGGESFPSEILSASRVVNEKGIVMIINGFERISGPIHFNSHDGKLAGFMEKDDLGVPNRTDISYIGKQYEFKRNQKWVNDDNPGFGASYDNHATQIIAGNSFDYPYLHGYSIAQAGYSFVSASKQAVMDKEVSLSPYPLIDLILGKERTTISRLDTLYQAFPTRLQNVLSEYYQNKGNLFISGCYVISDLWNNNPYNEKSQAFAEKILKCRWEETLEDFNGEVYEHKSILKGHFETIKIATTPNDSIYHVSRPDVILPVNKAFTFLEYANGMSAGIAYSGKNKTCVLGFPFETITGQEQRDQFMADVLKFLLKR